jgi:hypothetical protein
MTHPNDYFIKIPAGSNFCFVSTILSYTFSIPMVFFSYDSKELLFVSPQTSVRLHGLMITKTVNRQVG